MSTKLLKLRRNFLQSMSKNILEMLINHRAYETLSDDNKRKVYDSTGLDSNEQQQAGGYEGGGGGGFGFNPFGEAFWKNFGGGAAQPGAGGGSFDEAVKDFESFFSMGGNQKQRQQDQGRVRGKDVTL